LRLVELTTSVASMMLLLIMMFSLVCQHQHRVLGLWILSPVGIISLDHDVSVRLALFSQPTGNDMKENVVLQASIAAADKVGLCLLFIAQIINLEVRTWPGIPELIFIIGDLLNVLACISFIIHDVYSLSLSQQSNNAQSKVHS